MVYELKFTSTDLYIKSALFVSANILFPQLFHLVPGGGIMFLPIYFFTLISAMRFGWQTGVLTAVMTPIVGNLLFGAPVAAMVPDMLFKGSGPQWCSMVCSEEARYILDGFSSISTCSMDTRRSC